MTKRLTLRVLCVLCLLCVLYGVASSQSAAGPIYGFGSRAAGVERALERRLMDLPSADKAREAHATLTAEPHIAGSPRDRALAEWIRDRWREYGLEQVEIAEHQVLLPYPTDVRIEMSLEGSTWRASLKEDPVAGDPSTAVDAGLPFHAYSASGDVTAPVVYAGAGNPSDYDWLEAHGTSVKDKIALVRYSVPYSYRGFKAFTAQQRGAAGILIYSDPADDGYGQGKTYPNGPWGPDSHIQRGAIGYTFNFPGDPLTPGWASLPGAKRISPEESAALPTIMSAPLSAKDARTILEALKGSPAPATWQGDLPLMYRVGDGTTAVHMRVKMDDGVRPIWTVTGQITGTAYPDDLVILGNHRDAWVYGGVDPASGSASLMELARSLGALARQGSRPKRTILFASWDAEEFAATSSTEWGEQYQQQLSARAVAYLNVDSAASGTSFVASAVPSLNRLVAEAADAVVDPESARSIAAANGRGSELVNDRLGSGSDYTVFLNFLGIPIVDMSFVGPYGVYHSTYDDHAWVERFGDPGFRYHVAMARLWGVMALRLANADILPLDYRAYAARISDFVEELRGSPKAEHQNALMPAVEAVGRFARAADAIGARIDAVLAAGTAAPGDVASINHALMAAERAFISTDGVPGRPWYRHLIYAPMPTFAAEPLPGVAEAIASGDARRIRDQVARLVDVIDRAASVLRSAE